MKAGDWICFYESTNGVVAHAMVASKPERKPHPAVRGGDAFPWTFKLKNAELYLDDPVVIDAQLRLQLDAFKKRPKQALGVVCSVHSPSIREGFQNINSDKYRVTPIGSTITSKKS